MAEVSEVVCHPAFGKLGWLARYTHWFTQIRLPGGGRLDVILDPGDGDRHAFIEPASKLFRWALENERRILRDALQAELLGLYNETWRRTDEAELTEDELAGRMEWQLLDISPSEIVPVEFSYDVGALFGYHGVTVEVNAALQYRDIDLRG